MTWHITIITSCSDVLSTRHFLHFFVSEEIVCYRRFCGLGCRCRRTRRRLFEAQDVLRQSSIQFWFISTLHRVEDLPQNCCHLFHPTSKSLWLLVAKRVGCFPLVIKSLIIKWCENFSQHMICEFYPYIVPQNSLRLCCQIPNRRSRRCPRPRTAAPLRRVAKPKATTPHWGQ